MSLSIYFRFILNWFESRLLIGLNPEKSIHFCWYKNRQIDKNKFLQNKRLQRKSEKLSVMSSSYFFCIKDMLRYVWIHVDYFISNLQEIRIPIIQEKETLLWKCTSNGLCWFLSTSQPRNVKELSYISLIATNFSFSLLFYSNLHEQSPTQSNGGIRRVTNGSISSSDPESPSMGETRTVRIWFWKCFLCVPWWWVSEIPSSASRETFGVQNY